MIRGPQAGKTRTDHVGRAREAWGDQFPDWVEALAEEVAKTTLSLVGSRIGYAASTVSQVLSNSYRGDVGRIEEVVRGALLGTTVECPVLGSIGRDRCLQEQAEPFRATSAMRAQLYHACRSGCPNARERS